MQTEKSKNTEYFFCKLVAPIWLNNLCFNKNNKQLYLVVFKKIILELQHIYNTVYWTL